MTIRTFWTLFIKILGIWLILSGLTVFPQFLSAFTFFGDQYPDNVFTIIYIIALLFLTIGVYFIVLKLFVFNTSWLIDKLKLDQGFQEEKIDLNISLNTVLTITTIVIGGLILVDALPVLCRDIFSFIQQKNVFMQDPQFSSIIFYSVKTLIGYFMMTNSKSVIDFINKRTENKGTE